MTDIAPNVPENIASNPSNDPLIEKINNMTHIEMCHLWRFSAIGNPIFDSSKPYYDIFKKRFDAFGGMNAKISKEIGWGKHD